MFVISELFEDYIQLNSFICFLNDETCNYEIGYLSQNHDKSVVLKIFSQKFDSVTKLNEKLAIGKTANRTFLLYFPSDESFMDKDEAKSKNELEQNSYFQSFDMIEYHNDEFDEIESPNFQSRKLEINQNSNIFKVAKCSKEIYELNFLNSDGVSQQDILVLAGKHLDIIYEGTELITDIKCFYDKKAKSKFVKYERDVGMKFYSIDRCTTYTPDIFFNRKNQLLTGFSCENGEPVNSVYFFDIKRESFMEFVLNKRLDFNAFIVEMPGKSADDKREEFILKFTKKFCLIKKISGRII